MECLTEHLILKLRSLVLQKNLGKSVIWNQFDAFLNFPRLFLLCIHFPPKQWPWHPGKKQTKMFFPVFSVCFLLLNHNPPEQLGGLRLSWRVWCKWITKHLSVGNPENRTEVFVSESCPATAVNWAAFLEMSGLWVVGKGEVQTWQQH